MNPAELLKELLFMNGICIGISVGWLAERRLTAPRN